MEDASLELDNEQDNVSINERKSFKHICLKLGMMIIVIFASRLLGQVISTWLSEQVTNIDVTLQYLLKTVVSFTFVYAVPIIFTLILFGYFKKIPDLYKGSIQNKKAVANFPAIYGIGQTVNILTIVIIYIITSTSDLNKSFNTVNNILPANFSCAMILFVQLVVIAPIFEELWFRGVVMRTLQPYGTGFAILISAFLFGLTHANFNQFFYAFAIGICFGYIAYATKSLVASTILHAIFNSISGIMLLFLSTQSVGKFILDVNNLSAVIPDSDQIIITTFAIFMITAIAIAIIGFFMMIAKIRKIKKYIKFKNESTLTAKKRLFYFCTSFTVIIGMILAAFTFVKNI